jgi:hypothetical protein
MIVQASRIRTVTKEKADKFSVRSAASVEKRRYDVGIFAMNVKGINGITTSKKTLAYASIAPFYGMAPKELFLLNF